MCKNREEVKNCARLQKLLRFALPKGKACLKGWYAEKSVKIFLGIVLLVPT